MIFYVWIRLRKIWPDPAIRLGSDRIRLRNTAAHTDTWIGDDHQHCGVEDGRTGHQLGDAVTTATRHLVDPDRLVVALHQELGTQQTLYLVMSSSWFSPSAPALRHSWSTRSQFAELEPPFLWSAPELRSSAPAGSARKFNRKYWLLYYLQIIFNLTLIRSV